MNQLEEFNINWNALESEFGLKPAIYAGFAGVSVSMWHQVKSGNRNLSLNAQYRLMFGLATLFNFSNSQELLQAADDLVNTYHKNIAKRFPIENS